MKKLVALAAILTLASGLVHAGLSGDKLGQDNRQYLMGYDDLSVSRTHESDSDTDVDFEWSKSNNKKR